MSEYYDKNVNIPDGTNIPTIEEWIKSDEGKKVLRAYKNVKKL
ncbi:MAG: hypothetical protein CM15mV51_1080 [uncultured marine virus]|nr:MAG: hypothetical protein CM15mV51_1080 [uncultured marine virus]